MKKIKGLILLALACFIMLLESVGCSNSFDVKVDDSKPSVIIDSDSAERLTTYAVVGNYIVTEEELQADALMALASIKQKDEFKRSVQDISSDYKIIAVEKSVMTIPEDMKATRSAVESYNDINFYAYQFENTKTEEKNFVLSCDDRRIGEILAIADGEFNPDDDTPFMEIIATNLEAYVNETINAWNNLTSEDIRSARSNAYIGESTDYEVKNAYYTGYFRNLLKTKWNQNPKYNDFIRIEKGLQENDYTYPAGCVAVALAQICVKQAYPKYCSETTLSKLKELGCVPTEWNGEYDYYHMVYYNHYECGQTIYNLESEGEMNVKALLYDIGKGVKMNYGEKESGAYDSDAYNWLRSLNFTCSNVSDYNFSAVKNSIKYGNPVYISGARNRKKKSSGYLWWKKTWYEYSNGHAWVIDDYANLACDILNKKTNEHFWITDDFVHCNFGWGGKCNGYYITGVFNVSKGPEIKRQDILEGEDRDWNNYYSQVDDDGGAINDRYYRYNLKSIYEITCPYIPEPEDSSDEEE